ncbi:MULTISPECIES: type II toxin-antitoxin system RelE/ParE family toxin [Gammaproteobacteria]|uniref:ParE n=2 Tax=Vibrio TaxID=662 RepID=A0A220ISZ9_VIBCL|nr:MULTISPECIES: type II toxin-antitoxin system mRNA interferase toxin, RelE/StbE family [Vibrio]MDF5688720.1 type II toxin-antitoxin system RelE/ParE family toxin [Vibrio parahaemolyticus]ASI37976.1 ParE [Vibrio cholerae non-O1/non-O139]EGQ8581712.1 type II toxin-antitoxin system mRNA interferase toxin, RelE/StbE family [Vibrio cholerae]EGQ8581949.1 type II toxin-antitoxin system mRNA interferase toxin, RelE/StbE family [Vibrio cholerae]EGQ9325845.1 type II toxin-antitoxin system RelE/ParE fa
MQIKWLKKALINLEHSAEYLQEQNPQSARDFVKEVHELTELLKANPAMGRPGRVFGTRELILQKFPYIIPYRVKDNRIEILRVFPTRMNQPDFW